MERITADIDARRRDLEEKVRVCATSFRICAHPILAYRSKDSQTSADARIVKSVSASGQSDARKPKRRRKSLAFVARSAKSVSRVCVQ
jgi:hypothetical protein